MTPIQLKTLIGRGDKIGLFTLSFVVVGVMANIAFPSAFDLHERRAPGTPVGRVRA